MGWRPFGCCILSLLHVRFHSDVCARILQLITGCVTQQVGCTSPAAYSAVEFSCNSCSAASCWQPNTAGQAGVHTMVVQHTPGGFANMHTHALHVVHTALHTQGHAMWNAACCQRWQHLADAVHVQQADAKKTVDAYTPHNG